MNVLALDPRPATRADLAVVVPAAIAAATALAALAGVSTGWQGLLSFAWLALAGIAWRHPGAGLAIIAVAIPFEQRWSIPTVAGDTSLMEFTIWAVAFGVAPGLVRARRLAFDRVALLHLTVIVTLVLSFAAGDVRVSSWWQTVQFWVLAWLVYVITRSMRLSRRDRLGLVAVLAFGVIINAGVGFWQLVTGSGPDSYVVGGAVRVFGTFLQPNTLASYLVVVLPLLLAVSLGTSQGAIWIARFGAATGVVTLVLTQSRAGMLALGAAAIVLFVIAPRRLQRGAMVLAMASGLLLVATGAIDRLPGVDRFSSIAVGGEPEQVARATWGQHEREAHWGAARAMLRSNPLTGIGAGQFDAQFRAYTPEWRYRIGRGDAHNSYLQLGAEAGVPGLTAWVLWIGAIVVALWRRIRIVAGIDFWLAAGALGCAVAWAVDTIFEHPSVSSIPVMFVLVVALGPGGADHLARPSSQGRHVATGGVI